MANNNHSDEDVFFEDIVKKTKTGITFPKELRDIMFSEDAEIYFKLKVPKDKSKIILEVISEADAESHKKVSILKSKPELRSKGKKNGEIVSGGTSLAPNWGDYFVYDFKSREKVKPILESAFYKFAETPMNLEDAMGRVKYVLVSFLTLQSTTKGISGSGNLIKFLKEETGFTWILSPLFLKISMESIS